MWNLLYFCVCGHEQGAVYFNSNKRSLFSIRNHKEGEIVGFILLALHYSLSAQQIRTDGPEERVVDNLLI